MKWNIKDLSKIIELPKKPTGKPSQDYRWDLLFKDKDKLGSYIEFLEVFGAGLISGPDLKIITPLNNVNPKYSFEERGKDLIKIFNEFAPLELKKKVENFIPFGSDGIGNSLYFIKQNNSNQLEVLVLSEDTEEYEIYPQDLISFLGNLLCNKSSSLIPIQNELKKFPYISAPK